MPDFSVGNFLTDTMLLQIVNDRSPFS